MKVGDVITRMLAGKVPHELKITELTDTLITCGPWTFDRASGAEIDEFLNWGPPPKITGSFIKRDK